ncbi:DUF2220 family protein [Microbacterium mitrae]|uniref:DUF3322 and DUF2220 domain-containing protein n=1 Tax=Microbacterium mitrae TaxID=664640 RepID=A0A5C8HLE5_9MICO|nr:Wadjet anti-phage system protein JetD domain-containing protein [Microbacterium mitrae]TXK04116.1 hypothetical protein FVP60_10140 [Microbacterium mitrae]
MKSSAEFERDVTRRLERSWAEELVGPTGDWPRKFPLGLESADVLGADFGSFVGQIDAWRRYARERGLTLHETGRRVGAVTHRIPSHVTVEDPGEAAALVGSGWPERLARGAVRVREVGARFPAFNGVARLVRATDSYTDTDFDLLLNAGEWFRENTAQGLTPRQVPIEGFHAKWLNTSQHLVAMLAGQDSLGVEPKHPGRIHFSYLDPEYLATGTRRHDSATVGDSVMPAYHPRVVIISENKDTAIFFPQVPGGISVEGVGRGARAIASFDWIKSAPAVIYWGDMDADGLEILNEFRAAGVPATSILMDQDAFDEWERFGTNVDSRGLALSGRKPRDVPHLIRERELYLALVDAEWPRVRRIEQERIPLDIALREVERVTSHVGSENLRHRAD